MRSEKITRVKHKNIAIFIPHVGCENMCSFCNQRIISGQESPPTVDEVRAILTKASADISDKRETEIAFFGGSFTAIDREYRLSLLQTAFEFVGKNLFSGIRISTRPDAITEIILNELKQYGVTAIELGAQSMQDDVLELNRRGHTADDVIIASKLIKLAGISLGLQMMVGLYGDTAEGAKRTATALIALKPSTVRIYPTVILKGTHLETLYNSGEYKPPNLTEAVSLCADLLERFEQNSINVIKLGLHASTDVERDMVGGIYHQAFRELCESELFLRLALAKISQPGDYILEVPHGSLSKMIGQKKSNIQTLAKCGFNVKIVENNGLSGVSLRVTKNILFNKEQDVHHCY